MSFTCRILINVEYTHLITKYLNINLNIRILCGVSFSDYTSSGQPLISTYTSQWDLKDSFQVPVQVVVSGCHSGSLWVKVVSALARVNQIYPLLSFSWNFFTPLRYRLFFIPTLTLLGCRRQDYFIFHNSFVSHSTWSVC